MMTIDEFQQCLEEIADSLPESFFEGLNGGIIIEPKVRQHAQSQNHDLLIMGEYTRDSVMGNYITMFYGSFCRGWGHVSEDTLRNEIRKVLVHEFTHHLEGRAGLRDLEVLDEEQIAAYNKHKAAHQC